MAEGFDFLILQQGSAVQTCGRGIFCWMPLKGVGRVVDTKGWAAIAGTELSIPGTGNPIPASEISRPGFVAAGRSTDRHHRGTRDLGNSFALSSAKTPDETEVF